MQVNTKRGGRWAAIPLVLATTPLVFIYTYFPTETTWGQHFSSDTFLTFLPAIVVVILRIENNV